MRAYRIKKGDTRPSVFATLYDLDTRRPVDLAGADVRFHLSNEDGDVVVDEDAFVLNDGSTGGVRYDGWTSDQTNTPGRFFGEFAVTFPDSRVESFPKEAKGFPVLIVEDIA
jgi:hypothetical protein